MRMLGLVSRKSPCLLQWVKIISRSSAGSWRIGGVETADDLRTEVMATVVLTTIESKDWLPSALEDMIVAVVLQSV